MRNTICPFCKSMQVDVLYLVKDWYLNIINNFFFVVQCKKCRLARLDYLPIQEDINKIYPKEYFSQPNVISHIVKFMFMKKEVMKWKKLLPAKSRVLEIGCGNGEILNYFYKIGKFDVVGIEQNVYICNFAKEKYGLEIINADVEEYDLGEKRYDLVLMQHVLEHLKDPIDVIKKIHRALKEGGYLVIWIPFFDSLEQKIFGRYWAGFDAPRHLYFFSVDKITEILTEYGFSVKEVNYSAIPNLWIKSIRYFMKDKNIPFYSFFDDKKNIFLLSIFTIVSLICSFFKLSGQGKIVAQKV